jgi:hypothetical protein
MGWAKRYIFMVIMARLRTSYKAVLLAELLLVYQSQGESD